MAAEIAPASHWGAKRRRVFQSVFHTDSPLLSPQPGTTQVTQTAQSQVSTDFGSSVYPFSTAEASSALGTPFASQPILEEASQGQLGHAWHIVTSTLQIPAPSSAHDASGLLPPNALFHSQDEESIFNAALQVLLQAQVAARDRSEPPQPYEILAWYSHQMRRHFIQHVLPRLAAGSREALLSRPGASSSSIETGTYSEHLTLVQTYVQALEGPLRQYFARLSVILQTMEANGYLRDSNETSGVIMTRYTRDLHALIGNSAASIIPSLRVVLEVLVEQTLQIPRAEKRRRGQWQADLGPVGHEGARERLLHLVKALDSVGLAGESFQVLFAETMDRNMTKYVHRSYARLWKPPGKSYSSHDLDRDAVKSTSLTQSSWCIQSLCDWIEKCFARLALEVLSCVEKTTTKSSVVSLADVQQWKEIGIGRIASLRISELFDIVLQWPVSKGALDDLKASVTTPQRRWQLTDAFSAALQRRLLHPARSTLDILRVYVSMIRTFHALDHSKVLLGRVVPSLQLCLVQREDAVRMVVTGLLASPEEVEQAQKGRPSGALSEDSSGSGKLVELAVLLNDPDQQRRMDIDDEDLDWDDMEWVPDPVDAGVNYKRPKSEDVIGTLITTLGSEDIFIKEFQNIIAENLLSTQTDFTQEQQVLDLLKNRFSEAALQNCEVMIKDIYDSRKVDTHIRRVELGQPPRPARQFGTPSVPPQLVEMGKQLDADEEKQGQVPYHTRILSRLYWPNIVQETFKLPPPVAEQQEKYETGYERLKSARKLTWLHQLGQATVELDLEDRSVCIECKTFEAAVIYAFQDEEGEEGTDGGTPLRRTAQELQDRLQMDEELVLQALDFWETNKIITRYSSNPDTYVVLERRDAVPTRPELHPSASAPAAMEAEHQVPGMPPKPAAVKRAGTTSAMDAKENERRSTYWNFIVGMLTNTMPSMPLSQMAMMMRMLIPDGFPWSDEALQEFLTEKVELGELEMAGGKYKLVKK